MLRKIIGIGNKIELTRVGASAIESEGDDAFSKNKVYMSQVYDIIDDDTLKIAMPQESGKLILMPNNTRIDACFYTSKGLYQGRFITVERYKEGNLLVQVIELINELQKYQRRQYFRLTCTMDIMYRVLLEEEVSTYLNMQIDSEEELSGPMFPAVALDISGGGVRFVCKDRHEKDCKMLISLKIGYETKIKKYSIVGKLVGISETKAQNKLYEHRVEFSNMHGKVREDIIRFIFEEECKQRKKEKGQ
ncbi:MAG: hypothetical protein GX225_02830 [Clostridiales bacterium]|nr:hypothetical protein [Clostridiales bacterium]